MFRKENVVQVMGQMPFMYSCFLAEKTGLARSVEVARSVARRTRIQIDPLNAVTRMYLRDLISLTQLHRGNHSCFHTIPRSLQQDPLNGPLNLSIQ